MVDSARQPQSDPITPLDFDLKKLNRLDIFNVKPTASKNLHGLVPVYYMSIVVSYWNHGTANTTYQGFQFSGNGALIPSFAIHSNSDSRLTSSIPITRA